MVEGEHRLGLTADEVLTTTRAVRKRLDYSRRGLGTAWTTCHLTYEAEMAELLGIHADHVVQAALTPIAFTHGTGFRPGPRADHREFLHWNTWDRRVRPGSKTG